MDFGGFNDTVNDVLSPLQRQPLSGLLRLLLVVYGSMAAPHLPDNILKLFDQIWFRLLVLALIAWSASQDPAISILIAVSFYASMNALSGKKLFERFAPSPYQNQYYQQQQ